MKKQKKFRLRTMTDIKVFILFLLNNIGYPIDHTSVIGMVSENTEELIIDYDECLRSLAEDGHLYSDDYNGETYYMISDTGRMIAAQLYDSIDKEFREKSLRYAEALEYALVSVMSWVYCYDYEVPVAGNAAQDKINPLKQGGVIGLSTIGLYGTNIDTFLSCQYAEMF